MKDYQIESRYSVTSQHDVFVDDYEKGEGNHVNGYNIAREYVAHNPMNAIKKHFKDVLGYEFDPEKATVDNYGLFWDVLVDADNIEVSPESKEYKEWKEGGKVLYANSIMVTVNEIVKVDLEEYCDG